MATVLISDLLEIISDLTIVFPTVNINWESMRRTYFHRALVSDCLKHLGKKIIPQTYCFIYQLFDQSISIFFPLGVDMTRFGW